MSKKTETLEKYIKMLFDHSVRGIKSEIHFQLSSERTEGTHIINSESFSSDLEKWYICADEGLLIHENIKNKDSYCSKVLSKTEFFSISEIDYLEFIVHEK